MQVKKQYRWLLFMLIPFVILLVAHLLIPLQLLLNSQTTLTQSYNNQKLSLEQTLVRSQTLLNSEVLSEQMQLFQDFLSLMIRYMNNPPQKYLNINTNNIKLNNAFQFMKTVQSKNLASNYQENISMWFAANTNNTSSFSPIQNQIYSSYLQIQPFLRASFNITSYYSNGLIGLFSHINYLGQQMSFSFPSQTDNNIIKLGNAAFNNYYSQTIENYVKSNKTIFFTNFVESGLLKMCTVLNSLDETIGIACLKIDIVVFGEQLFANLIPPQSNFTSLAYSLVTPLYPSIVSKFPASGAFPQVIISLQNNNTISYPLASYFTQYSYLSTDIWTPYWTSDLYSIFVYRQILSTLYQIPIVIQDSNENSKILFYLFLQNNFEATSLDSAQTYNEILKTILIPILILIAISVVASIMVLRFLLNTLDVELTRLNDCCKFIVDQDIDIEIPTYHGTKDINQVYDEVRIINKLHKYTSPAYFVGHFANKILKYNEALQIIRYLGYNAGYLLENIGQCYLNIEEYDRSVKALKQSIQIILKDISDKFGSFERVFEKKLANKKLSQKYKELEIVLIRRLWKLNFTYFKYLELSVMNVKKFEDEPLKEKQFIIKKEQMQKDQIYYSGILKKAFYPDYGKWAEAILNWSFQAKCYVSMKNFIQAKENVEKSMKFAQLYTRQYNETNIKLKEEGKKNRILAKRLKLTAHSRAHPQIVQGFSNYMKAIILLNQPFPYKRYYEAFCYIVNTMNTSVVSVSVNYLACYEAFKILKESGVGMKKYENLQIFRQSMPLKTLFYGQPQDFNDPSLYKICSTSTPGLERQYVFILDCSRNSMCEKSVSGQEAFVKETTTEIFEKFILKRDRISIVRCNSDILHDTICNLTFKESNEKMLKLELEEAYKSQEMKGKSNVHEIIDKIITRVCKLQSEKIIIVCLKYLDVYIKEAKRFKAKQKSRKSKEQIPLNTPTNQSKSKLRSSQNLIEIESPKVVMQEIQEEDEEIQSPSKIKIKSMNSIDMEINDNSLEKIGESIKKSMEKEGLRNCKLLLLCAVGDEAESVRNSLGLNQINKRLWSCTDGLNKSNNIVYVIESKKKKDISRILASKYHSLPDNHVFAL